MKSLKKLSVALFMTVAAVAVLAISCTKSKYQSVENDPTQTRIYTLDNGLTVYLSVIKKEPRIQTYIAVRTGSKNDPAETTGLSHYLEHLMFKGTHKLGTINYEAEKPLLDRIEQEYEEYRLLTDPQERKAKYAVIDSLSYEASKYFVANEYDKVMAAMGAQGTNAFTSFDMTVYTEDIPSNQVEAWAKIQSDRFMNMVIRGFHTELEAVYEECNLSLMDDSGNAIDTLFFAMFDKHPYGLQTTIGTQEHLKNPSIVNIKKHFENFYVPNNVAICMAGDFDPDQVIGIIKKYFGEWKRNDNLKMLDYEAEAPIKEPIVKTLYGQEAPMAYIGWRFPSPYSPYRESLDNTADTLYILNKVLYNGKAGLMDQDLNRQQKVLFSGSFTYGLTDYTLFLMMFRPKDGQSLEEGTELLLQEIEKVKRGEFDQSLITAVINNERRDNMEAVESYRYRASRQYSAFINRLPWDYVVGKTERLAKITKEDLVGFVNRNFSNNYVFVKKLQGQPEGVQQMEKPAITEILTNRDTSSAFLKEVSEMIEKAKPIEPVFIDFDKDMVKTTVNGLDFYYKHNDYTELFDLTYRFENGDYDNPLMQYAAEYVKNLGTTALTADQINMKFYELASNNSISSNSHNTSVWLNGLNSTMDEGAALFKDILANVQPDEQLLNEMKLNWLRSLYDAKMSERSKGEALLNYVIYGPQNPFILSDLRPGQIMSLTSEDLIGAVKDLFNHKFSIIYYGPLSLEEATAKVEAITKTDRELAEYAPSKIFTPEQTTSPAVLVAPHISNKIAMNRVSVYSNKEEDIWSEAVNTLYDSYFGSGMSSIVFQDLREAKGLAYSAGAYTRNPARVGETPYYMAYISTQTDKMLDAMAAFDKILEDMPVAEKSFEVIKNNLLQRLATQRYNGSDVIYRYFTLKNKGAALTYDKDLYEQIQKVTLQDVVEYHDKYVKGLTYRTGILGEPSKLNTSGIDTEKYGNVKVLKVEDIFGY